MMDPMQNRPATMSQEQVFAIIGQQHVELLVLRERIGLLTAHRCQPCPNECCATQPPSVPTPEDEP